ncbi:MAG TPA: hypothetical protein DEO83_08780 [Lachnospiraceae bacterium]|nr:hypothetical protein [Lachnospiraceae bacterium]
MAYKYILGVLMMKKKLLSIITSCIFAVASIAPAQGISIVNAEETTAKSPISGYTLLESKYEKPGEDSISVGVPGSYLAEQQDALDRINEIRKEACDKGYPDPRDPKKKLSSSDYVPIKWSFALEEYARVRACEASVYGEHTRPGTNEALVEGSDDENGYVSGTSETLAWPGNSLKGGVNLWYTEKDEWVSGGTGVTGHYTSMINPHNEYVGLGGFKSDFNMGNTNFNSCICGRFSSTEWYSFPSTADELKRLKDETMAPELKNIVQVISINKSSVYKPNLSVLENDYAFISNKGLYLGEKAVFAMVSKVKIDSDSASVIDINEYTYSSSKPGILKVDADGKAETKNTGKVTVKAVNAGGKEYTLDMSITAFLSKPKVKLSSTKKKKIKAKLTATKKDVVNMTYFEVQTATDKKFTKNVKTTKVKTKVTSWYNPKTTFSKTIKGFKSKKKYYVRVRAVYENKSYKNNDKSVIKVYSKWSSSKKIKVK